jgi:hypothetical protein
MHCCAIHFSFLLAASFSRQALRIVNVHGRQPFLRGGGSVEVGLARRAVDNVLRQFTQAAPSPLPGRWRANFIAIIVVIIIVMISSGSRSSSSNAIIVADIRTVVFGVLEFKVNLVARQMAFNKVDLRERLLS